MKNKTKLNNKAVIYARFSPRRNAAECESCAAQIEYCSDYCRSKRWNVIAEFQDDAISGKRSDNRPGLKRAMDLCVQEKATLVVYSLSRLARNTTETLAILSKLEFHRCGFSSRKEEIDTTTPVGRLIVTILAAIQQMEREVLSERTSDSMRYYQSQGRRMSSKPPYGYAVCPTDPARLVEHVSEQAVIRRIIDLRNQNMGLRQICRELDAHGIKPRYHRSTNGKKHSGWHHSTIRSILDAHC